MTYGEYAEARLWAEQAGFPTVGSESIAAEDGAVYAVQIKDVEAGRTLTFLHLASVQAYIAATLAQEAKESAPAA